MVVVNSLLINNVKWEFNLLYLLLGKVKLDFKVGNICDKNDIVFEGFVIIGFFS